MRQRRNVPTVVSTDLRFLSEDLEQLYLIANRAYLSKKCQFETRL